jgi:hypothetical protein
MSYDVAVWEGEVPASDEEALEVFERLCERYDDADEPASPRILDYIGALTERYPDLMDLPEEEVDESPWAIGPLAGTGPFFYFSLTFDGAEDALAFVAEAARSRGLVCFDPQRPGLI